MPTTFVLTPQESLLWESIRRPFRTSAGEQNTSMTDAFVAAASASLDKFNPKTDYHVQLPRLLVFLKSYPDYIEGILPKLYKMGHKNDQVRVFLDDLNAADPQVLTKFLPQMFASEKALAMQIPLLMDMGQYLDKDVFGTLDFKLLLKASPEKLLKAFTPTPATWDAFMKLAKGLAENDTTKDLANNIACSVGLQIATAKPKDAKSKYINQYDWLDTALFWQKHGWEWDVGRTLDTMELRAKGESLVVDMVHAMSNPQNPRPEKALETMHWLVQNYEKTSTTAGVAALDSGVLNMYSTASDRTLKDVCLSWLNARAERCNILQNAWRVMPPEDLVVATKKLVTDVLEPMGMTKAKALTHLMGNARLPGTLPLCGTRLFTTLNHTNLPLGDVDEAMRTILHKWCDEFPKVTASSYDHRQHAVTDMLDTIVHDLQEPVRQGLQQSDAFKQLMLYSAYLKHTNPNWSTYSFDFMPDLTETPLSMLSVVYPEHQDAWAKVQHKVLDGTFKREDTVQLIAKVLFNQDLTVGDIVNTSAALGCPPELFICNMKSPGAYAFIPESFDFTQDGPL